MTRRQWQALNAIRAGAPATRPDLRGLLRDFATDSELDDLVDGLVARGWVEERAIGHRTGPGTPAAPTLALTATGSDAVARIAGVVRQVRDRTTAGISGDDYDRAVDTLRRMAANLESPDEPAPTASTAPTAPTASPPDPPPAD